LADGHGAEPLLGRDLERLFTSFDSARITVVGDFCLDAYWQLTGDDSEMSIETGLPVRHVGPQRYSLGGAGNVVANLRALGVREVRAIGFYGRDPFGMAMLGLLVDLGVDVTGLADLGSSWQTLVYAKPYLDGSEQERIDFGSRGRLPDGAVRCMIESLTASAGWAHAVVINQQVAGCFAQSDLVASINAVIEAYPGTIFLVDDRDTAAAYTGAILKLNAGEAAAMVDRDAGTGGPFSDKQASQLAEQVMGRTGHPVFITRGNRGIVATDRDGVYEALGIEITQPVDPVGAGDTVVAAIAAVLAIGGDVSTAAFVANVAGSVTVRKIQTTGTVTAAELTFAAEHADYVYNTDLAENPAQARHLPGGEIELVDILPMDPRPTHVIFDHDGTLSTLRQGWEEVMEPMMVRAMLGPRYEDVDGAVYQRVRSTAQDFIDRTTGVQTLVQMQGLAEWVRRLGFVPEDEVLDEHAYKEIYNTHLLALVRGRLAKLSAGHLQREDFHVKNALPLLERLRQQGVMLYLASGTDRDDVVDEARALGFEEFFGDRIYGSVGDVTVEAKRLVLDRIIKENQIDGSSLVCFGDGPVEMRETRKRRGIAVGVCSDEKRRYGFNPAKRARLIRGGAAVLIPDFSDLESIFGLLGLANP
jgi:rfaE bifunctional protein kinase chain/domain